MQLNRRQLSLCAALALAPWAVAPVLAQSATPIKFQLDWRFEGPAALFLHPAAKGHFKQAGLDVTVDAGNGSGAPSRAWPRAATTWALPTWRR